MPTVTDWLMVAITTVYVVATIFICWANIKSAKATREQVAESKRQFEEVNRAYITYSFIYEKKAFYGIRFTNHGKRVAKDIQICLKEAFIDSLDEPDFVSALKSLNNRRSILGVEQSFDIYIGTYKFNRNQYKLPIEGEIFYTDGTGEYREPFFIDFGNYPPIFSVDGIEEDIREELRSQTKELAKIQRELHKLLKALQKEEKEENA